MHEFLSLEFTIGDQWTKNGSVVLTGFYSLRSTKYINRGV